MNSIYLAGWYASSSGPSIVLVARSIIVPEESLGTAGIQQEQQQQCGIFGVRSSAVRLPLYSVPSVEPLWNRRDSPAGLWQCSVRSSAGIVVGWRIPTYRHGAMEGPLLITTGYVYGGSKRGPDTRTKIPAYYVTTLILAGAVRSIILGVLGCACGSGRQREIYTSSLTVKILPTRYTIDVCGLADLSCVQVVIA